MEQDYRSTLLDGVTRRDLCYPMPVAALRAFETDFPIKPVQSTVLQLPNWHWFGIEVMRSGCVRSSNIAQQNRQSESIAIVLRLHK